MTNAPIETNARPKPEWMTEMDYSAYIYLYNKVGWAKAEQYYKLCVTFDELQVKR